MLTTDGAIAAIKVTVIVNQSKIIHLTFKVDYIKIKLKSKGGEKMEGYKEIKELISDIDEFHTEAELREILQEILFICEDNLKEE